MRIFDSLKRGDLIAHRFFWLVFAATGLLMIGCSSDKTPSNALSKTPSNSSSPAAPPRKLNSADAIAAFEKANLEVASPHPVDKSKDAEKVNVEGAKEIEGTEFSIPSTGKNMRGRVLSYANFVDAAEMTIRYEGVANLFENSSEYKNSLYWNLNHQNLIIQISRKVPREKARLYFDALRSVK